MIKSNNVFKPVYLIQNRVPQVPKWLIDCNTVTYQQRKKVPHVDIIPHDNIII